MAGKGNQINVKIVVGIGAVIALGYLVSKYSGSGQASVPVNHIENNINIQDNDQQHQNNQDETDRVIGGKG